MTKIGLLSDTHGYIDQPVLDFFEPCQQIWHAGDAGNITLLNQLAGCKPLKAVYGNIDGIDVRTVWPAFQQFTCEKVEVWITHIGGYPSKYQAPLRKMFELKTPNLFICGHSHILKVMFDKQYNFLHINPGAAGKSGFHQVRTAVRFNIDNENISNLEVLELKK